MTVYCGLRAAGCGLRAAGCGLRAAGCGLRAAGCGLRAAGCGLRADVTLAAPPPMCMCGASRRPKPGGHYPRSVLADRPRPAPGGAGKGLGERQGGTAWAHIIRDDVKLHAGKCCRCSFYGAFPDRRSFGGA
ncbi:hypothetical protein D8B31_17835 [Verminephrobacter eiseniae]|nr:hypothetical protein [Verminephrobacter eiseniae]